MPIYEYACSACGARFEKLVRRFGEAVACPSCSSAAVDKQLSVFAVSVASARALPCGASSPAQMGCGAGACGGGGCGLPS